jgi:hypothetical protein
MYDNKRERGGRPNIDEVVSEGHAAGACSIQQWRGLSDLKQGKQVADRPPAGSSSDFRMTFRIIQRPGTSASDERRPVRIERSG